MTINGFTTRESLPAIPGINNRDLQPLGHGLYGKVVTVTPQMAKMWLDLHNTDNFRKPTNSSIDQYAEDMRDGRWQLNGESIVFSDDGVLLNGQNRLYACVRSQANVHINVVVGPPHTEEIDGLHRRCTSS